MAHRALNARLSRWCCFLRGQHASAVLSERNHTLKLSWTGPTKDDEDDLTHTRKSP